MFTRVLSRATLDHKMTRLLVNRLRFQFDNVVKVFKEHRPMYKLGYRLLKTFNNSKHHALNIRCCNRNSQNLWQICLSQDFNNLFLFSLLFSLSTLFLCIFSAIFSYRSLSSLAALLSLIACIRRCKLCVSGTRPRNKFQPLPVSHLLFLLSSPSPWPSLPPLLFAR